MNKYKEAAKQILKKHKKPLHYKEITRLALEEGILETDGKTPESSMNAQIVTDIKNKGDASDFIKTAPATYSINQDKKAVTEEAVEKDKSEEEKIQIES